MYIKCEGVHQWYMYMMVGQQCCKTVFQHKIKNGGARLKGGGAPWYHPLGETLIHEYIHTYVHVHGFSYSKLCSTFKQLSK